MVDAQLPPGLAVHLRALGHEAHHVEDLGLRSASDAMIWRHVCDCAGTLITKDQDFAGFAAGTDHDAAVIWIRLGNTANEALWQVFEPLLPEIVDALARGERLIEVR